HRVGRAAWRLAPGLWGRHISGGMVMRTRNLAGVFLVLMVSLLLGACASSQSGASYNRNEARAMQEVDVGRVVADKPATIEGTKSGAGTRAGGVRGGIAGSGAGGGTGRALSTAAGAVVGAMAGSAAEEGVTRAQGLQLIVKPDSGRTIAVVQK